MTAPTESPADRLAEIRARAEAEELPPAPWFSIEAGGFWVQMEDGTPLFEPVECEALSNFAAHARTDIPWLLDEVERLRAALERISEGKARTAVGWKTPSWEASLALDVLGE